MTDTVSIPVAEATFEQLKWIAETTYGLTLHHSISNPATVLAKIKQTGFSSDNIEVPQHLVGPVPPATPANEQADIAEASDETEIDWEEYVYITISKTQEEDQPVPVSVNGTTILIPRGKRVAVKRKYVHVLENAIGTQYREDQNGGGLIAYDSQSYPVSVHS